MKQSIGQSWTLYFISIFILIVFAFLCGILNYMKAFKVNSSIANALENYEGFNYFSTVEIDNKLYSIGYRKQSNDKKQLESLCADHVKKHGGTLETNGINHAICISDLGYNGNYFKYGITTFIYLDLPMVSEIKIPIYSESEKIYDFNKQVDEE